MYILLSLPKKEALGWDMASQLTCYVCAPMVHCRQSSHPISMGRLPVILRWCQVSLHMETASCQKECMARPNNHRPIALLPVVGKVWEKLSKFKKLYHFVSPLLSDNQCVSFAEKTARHINSKNGQNWALDKTQCVGSVFFDFKKVFGKVWHKALRIKLEFAGINHHALAWFKNYLSDRCQRIDQNEQFYINASQDQRWRTSRCYSQPSVVYYLHERYCFIVGAGSSFLHQRLCWQRIPVCCQWRLNHFSNRTPTSSGQPF